MYLTQLATVARRTGFPVVEISGWKTRGHGGMSAVKTIACHHTAGPRTGNYPSLGVVRDGRPGLDGPLAHLGLGRDGTIYVIAAGKCYHAGVVKAPAYANENAVGIEAEATGVDDWPEVQMDAYRALCAELTQEFGLSVARVMGHKEICAPVGRKSDPNFNMTTFRGLVTAYLRGDDMPLTDSDIDKIAAAVWARPVPRPGNTPASAGSQLGGANINSYRALRALNVPELAEQIAAKIPAGQVVDKATLSEALRDVLGSLDGDPA